MSSVRAKGSKKTRKIGRNALRHAASIRYRNEHRHLTHQIADLRRHLVSHPSDAASSRRLSELLNSK